MSTPAQTRRTAKHRGQYAALLHLAAGHPSLTNHDRSTARWPELTQAAFHRLFDTSIGACIYYLPQSKAAHFNGKISVHALRAWVEVPGYKPVHDHVQPRKTSANVLLSFLRERRAELTEKEWLRYLYEAGIDEVQNYCQQHFLSFALVTTSENMALKNWPLHFMSHQEAAEVLGISFFAPCIGDKSMIYSELMAFVSHLKDHPVEAWELEPLTSAFQAFLAASPD